MDNPEKNGDAPQAGSAPPAELDQTRPDVELGRSLGKEPTKTEIRVTTEGERKKGALSKIFFPPLFGRLKPFNKYAGIWTPDSDTRGLGLLGFVFSRLVTAVAGIGLLYLLFKSALNASGGEGDISPIILATAGVALVFSLLSVVLKWHPAWFSGFPLLAILGLLTFHVLFYPTTDPSFFTFPGKAPAFIFNHVWLGILGFELALLFFVYPRTRLLKWVLFGMALYGLAGFAANRMEGIALESAWLGTGIFKVLPIIFLQPVVAVQILFVPLFFLVSIGAFFLPLNLKTGRSFGWIGLNIPVLFLSGVMGWTVMHQNGVPTLLAFFLEESRGIGLVQSSVGGQMLTVKTANFDLFKEKDTVERYRMELKGAGPLPKGESASNKYYFSVYDLDGFPVFFLTKPDIEVSIEGQKLSQWDIEPVEASEEVREKNGMRRPPLYLLSVGRQAAVIPKDLSAEKVGETETKETRETAADSKKIKPIAISSLWDLADKDRGDGSQPRLDFAHPMLGEYVPVETKVEVAVEEKEGKSPFEIVTLFLNDEKIHEWTGDPSAPRAYTWLWNTADLPRGAYVLKVEGRIGQEIASSDMVPVFMGEARLIVEPPEGSVKGKAGVLNYQDLIFVLDFSISQWDGWMGRPKWEGQKTLFEAASVIQKLNGSNVGVVVFGNRKSYYQQDCADASFLVQPSVFNSRKIVELLGKEKPKGASALFEAVRMALEKKPEKIVVITDGADSCHAAIGSFIDKPPGGKAGGTVIDVLTPGEVSEKDAKILKELAERTHGSFVSAGNQKEFEEKARILLTRYFHLRLGDKTILSAPVDGRPNTLRPGRYTLGLSMSPPFADRPIVLKNGLTTEIRLKVQGDKTEAGETYSPF